MSAREHARQAGPSAPSLGEWRSVASSTRSAGLFAAYDLHVTCANHECRRHGGILDGPAFLAHYGLDHPVHDIVVRLRCSKCGSPAGVSIVHALNSMGERIEEVAWPRIQPPRNGAQPYENRDSLSRSKRSGSSSAA